MTDSPAPAATPASRTFVQRIAPYVVIAAGWAVLHLLAAQTILAHGLDRPFVLVGGGATVLLVAGVLAAALAVGLLSRALTPSNAGADALYRFGVVLALSCWSISTCLSASSRQAPTIDDWLMIRNVTPGVLSGAPYWKLLPDLLVLAAAALLVLACLRDSRVWGRTLTKAEWLRGLQATGITIAAGGVGLFFLNGPPYQKTFQFQSFFAAWASLWLGAMIARYATSVSHPVFYWPAPFVLCAIGLVFAAVKPGLPGQYSAINVIPPWGLARPLPIELIAFGLIGAMEAIWKGAGTKAAARAAENSAGAG